MFGGLGGVISAEKVVWLSIVNYQKALFLSLSRSKKIMITIGASKLNF